MMDSAIDQYLNLLPEGANWVAQATPAYKAAGYPAGSTGDVISVRNISILT
ncbi:MAG: hypothetical protein ACTHLT_19005 [Devosia sp.]